MSAPSNHPHAVRRVVLPSGKTIEVVYFNDGAPEQAAAAPHDAAQLHHCPECDSDLVYPTAWVQAGEDRWSLTLRCPNCERHSEGSYDHATVQRLDEELDRGTHAVLTDLKQLMHANMEAEIVRFVSALDADHIWPIDF
ncbi:MAG: hypothetical protein M3Z33_08660 [Actinomycetota bacterium]|nr:hypothetical protein [Actinomycetota bacterium]